MIELTVAKEPVIIPTCIFSYQKKCENIYEHWQNDFSYIAKYIRKFEYGVIILENFEKYYLLYIDKSGFPNLCGHATIGLINYISNTNFAKDEYLFYTKAGIIRGQKTSNNIQISMPVSNIIETKIKHNLKFVKNAEIVKSGNQYILCELENIQKLNIQKLQEISKQLINKYNVYGIFWYSFITLNNHIDTKSLTIFGKKGQIDLSPCGTGSSSLATLLTKKKILSSDLVLNNYSLNNEKFMVTVSNSEEIRPKLFFNGKVNYSYKNELKFNKLNPNWKIIKL